MTSAASIFQKLLKYQTWGSHHIQNASNPTERYSKALHWIKCEWFIDDYVNKNFSAIPRTSCNISIKSLFVPICNESFWNF